MTLQAGRLLSHYCLVEQIGEGGMGVVWKALDTKLNRHVALKVLPADLTCNPERRRRFLREAQATAALDHPNIAVIHEVGESEGTLFLAMQLLDGRTLHEVIRQRRLSLREWLRLALPVAEGLAHAHRHGIAHRDLKPENVMITEEHQVKLLDFGLAKILEPDLLSGSSAPGVDPGLQRISQEVTRAGKVFGTVTHMSPEQARGEPVDHRSDIFSLGVLLYEMASGILPFKKSSDVETLNAVIHEEPPSLSRIAGEYPAEAERVIRKAMEKEPERRYQHADDLVTDLKNLKRDLDLGRTSITTAEVSIVTGRRRYRYRMAGVVGVVVAAMAGLGYLYWKPGHIAPVPTEPESRTVAVMGFENVTDPKDTDHLGRALMGLVTTDLAESGGLEVVSTAKVLAALKQAGAGTAGVLEASLAPEAARRAEAEVMLVGQVTETERRLLLAAELVDVESGKTLGSLKREAGSREELFALAGAIARDVRRELGVSLSGTDEPSFDLARALTSSPAAYRQYAAGEIALHEKRYTRAVERFRRAVEEDPDFAMAYYRLGLAHLWTDSLDESIETLQKGLAHIDRLPERWRVVYRAYLDWQQGRRDAAYEALSKLIATSPAIPDAYYILAEVVTHADPYRDPMWVKDLLERALEIDPSFRVVDQHLIESYILGDDLGAAERLLERSGEGHHEEVTLLLAKGETEAALARSRELRDQRMPWTPFRTTQAYLLAADWNGAYRLADELASGPYGTHAVLGRGTALAGQGRFKEAILDLREAVRLEDQTAEHSEDKVRPSAFRLNLAQLLEAVGETDEALETARTAIELDPDSYRAYFWLGRFLLRAGRNEEAREALAQVEEVVGRLLSPSSELWPHLLRAEVGLAERNLAAVQNEMFAISELAPEYQDPFLQMLMTARLRAASGDRSGAVTVYREMLKPEILFRSVVEWPIIQVSPLVVERFRALHALARLEEEEGNLEAARQHCGELLIHWGEADMRTTEVEDAKSRLAAMGSR